jgi:hypothetical protein|tara:strand:+ start:484 stop:765 length:282 start_codon:yes stop_codon:yes gene_type:complete
MIDTKHIHEIMTKLKESDGWKHLTEVIIKEDILKAALDMAENKPMTPDEFNFRRGSMHAAHNFSSIPDKIISQYEDQVNWDESLAAAKEKGEG